MKNVYQTSMNGVRSRFYMLIILMVLSLSGFAQNVGINSTGAAPNAAAGLDVNFTDKGMLIPRVALTSTSSFAPLSAHVAGMLVYNTATAGDVLPGFYYNTGSAWIPGLPAASVTGTMLYWNGLSWVGIPPGLTGQYLQVDASSKPYWGGTNAATASLTTTAAFPIGTTTATTGGNIINNAGLTVLANGVCYGLASNPTTASSTVTASPVNPSGAFTCNLTGLLSGTKYYVRAYAVNNSVTSYGAEISFTTVAYVPTVAATTTAGAVTSNSATSGGNITADGGAPILERGVCYATTQNPTILTGTKVPDSGTATGTYSVNLTGLTGGTLYYVRAYATNSVGTAYGPQISFTTDVAPPTLVTVAATSITGASAISGASMNWNGGGYSNYQNYGIAYATTANSATPTYVATNTGNGSVNPLVNIAPWTTNLTGLTANTTYYIRSYLNLFKTGTGWVTVFGNELSFATTGATAPLMGSTTTPTTITASTATSGGTITSDGGSSITDKGVCWGTSPSPTLGGGNFTSMGTGTGAFGSSITGLTGNTTYYVRSYATNAVDTSYGPERSFTTCTTPAYNIGDQVGGGIVFYVNCDGSGLIAALEDQSASVTWGCSGSTFNTASTIGTGAANTTAILNGCATRPIAASVAHDYQGGGFSDWYLPSSSELYEMMVRLNLGGTYWTSSDGGSKTVASTYYNYNNIQASAAVKTYSAQVRAIRSFGAPSSPTVTTDAVSGIGSAIATSGGNVTASGGASVTAYGVCWSTTQTPTISNSHTTDGSGIGTFTSTISGLASNTLYYVRAYATNVAGTAYGNEVNFTSLATITPPTVTTTAITNILATSVSTGGEVTSIGGGPVTDRGVCYSLSSNPTIADGVISNGSGLGIFTINITGLNPSTNYHVRAYALNGGGYSYGADVSFTTAAPPPPAAVTTTAITNLQASSVTTGGNVTSDGGDAVIARGVCYSQTATPTIFDSSLYSGTGTGTYTINIAGLTPETTYHVRAFAQNGGGYFYGSDVSFTTIAATAPIVGSTSTVSNITATTASSGGTIINAGGSPITGGGVCWSTTSPAVLDLVVPNYSYDGYNVGSYVSQLNGLTPGTTYYIRAYATNSLGTTYSSNEQSFTTVAPVLPSVTTTAVTNILGTSATSGGDVTNEGGDIVWNRGICWSLSTDPIPTSTASPTNFVLYDTKSGLGSFAGDMTGLAPGTDYHVRAFAINTAGTGYGSDVLFTTGTGLAIPSITTDAFSNQTSSTVTTGGTITSDGGSAITARGVCWSITNSNPTIADTKIPDSNPNNGLPFVSNLTGLTVGTNYYVRAYATNAQGTAYGTYLIYTPIGNPTVTTYPLNYTPGSDNATAGVYVLYPFGGDVNTTLTAMGICWGTSPNPDIVTHTGITSADIALLGNLSYSEPITGLITAPATTYYVRAYGTNSAGFTGYGAEITFTTDVAGGAPSVATEPITDLLGSVAIGGLTILSDGGSLITAGGVCWGLSANPDITTHLGITNDGTFASTYASGITGLTIGTTYHVRAYATNGNTTSYGADISFVATAATVGQFVNGGTYNGIIYFIDGTGSHGLISSFGYSYTDWGCTGSNVGTTLTNGVANTDAIVSNITSGSCLSGSTLNMFAANASRSSGPAWYLPSKDEFIFLWNNRSAGGLNYSLTSTGGPYWSSSEVDGTAGTAVWFFDGTTWQNTGAKSSLMKVWPIRSF